jgi:hypothetical protein
MSPILSVIFPFGDMAHGFTALDVGEGVHRLENEFPHPFCGKDSIFYRLQKSGLVEAQRTDALFKRLLYETGTSDQLKHRNIRERTATNSFDALVHAQAGHSVVFTSSDILDLDGQLYYGGAGVVAFVHVFPWAFDLILSAQAEVIDFSFS